MNTVVSRKNQGGFLIFLKESLTQISFSDFDSGPDNVPNRPAIRRVSKIFTTFKVMINITFSKYDVSKDLWGIKKKLLSKYLSIKNNIGCRAYHMRISSRNFSGRSRINTPD